MLSCSYGDRPQADIQLELGSVSVSHHNRNIRLDIVRDVGYRYIVIWNKSVVFSWY